jgi:hypothetical protein
VPEPEEFRVLDRNYQSGSFYISLPSFHVSLLMDRTSNQKMEVPDTVDRSLG